MVAFQMIDTLFLEWIKNKEGLLQTLGFTLEIIQTPADSPNPAVRANIDSNDYLSQIIVWRDGSYNIDAIQFSSEVTLITCSREGLKEDMFAEVFNELMNHMQANSNPLL